MLVAVEYSIGGIEWERQSLNSGDSTFSRFSHVINMPARVSTCGMDDLRISGISRIETPLKALGADWQLGFSWF